MVDKHMQVSEMETGEAAVIEAVGEEEEASHVALVCTALEVTRGGAGEARGEAFNTTEAVDISAVALLLVMANSSINSPHQQIRHPPKHTSIPLL